MSPNSGSNDFLEKESFHPQAFPITDTAVDRELSTFEDEPPLDYIQRIPTPKQPCTHLHQIPQTSPSNPPPASVYDVSPTVLHAYEKGFADVFAKSEGSPNAPPPTPQAVANHVVKGGACASREGAEAVMRNVARREVINSHKVCDALKIVDLTLTAVETRMGNDRILSGLLSKLGRDVAEMALTKFYMGRSEEHRGLMKGRSVVEERLAQEVRRLQDAVYMDHIRGNVLVTGHAPDLVQRMEDVEMESARLRERELEAVERELELAEREVAKEGGQALESMLNVAKEWCLRLKNQHMEERQRKELKQMELQRGAQQLGVDAVVAFSQGHKQTEQDGERACRPHGADIGAGRVRTLPVQSRPAASTSMYDPARKVPVPPIVFAATGDAEGRPVQALSRPMYLETPSSHATQLGCAHISRQQHPPATTDAAIRDPPKFCLADAVNAALRQQPIPVAQLEKRYGSKAYGSSGTSFQHASVTGPSPCQPGFPPLARPEYGAQPSYSTPWPHYEMNPSRPHMQAQHAVAPTQPNYFPYNENAPTHPSTSPFMQNPAVYSAPPEYGTGRPHSLSHNPEAPMVFVGANQIAQHGQMHGYGPTPYTHGIPTHQVVYQQYSESSLSYPPDTYRDDEVLQPKHPGHLRKSQNTQASPSQPGHPLGYPCFERHELSARLSGAYHVQGLPHNNSTGVEFENTHPLGHANACQMAGGQKSPSHVYVTRRGPSTLLEAEDEYYLVRFAKEAPQGATGRAVGQAALNPVVEQNLAPHFNAQPIQVETGPSIPHCEVPEHYKLQRNYSGKYTGELFRRRETVVTKNDAQLTAEMMQQNTRSYEEYMRNLKEVARVNAQPSGADCGNGNVHQITAGQMRRRISTVNRTDSDIVTGAIPVESFPYFPEMGEIRDSTAASHIPGVSGGERTVSKASNHTLDKEMGVRVVMPQMSHGVSHEAARTDSSTNANHDARALQSMINAFDNMNRK